MNLLILFQISFENTNKILRFYVFFILYLSYLETYSYFLFIIHPTDLFIIFKFKKTLSHFAEHWLVDKLCGSVVLLDQLYFNAASLAVSLRVVFYVSLVSCFLFVNNSNYIFLYFRKMGKTLQRSIKLKFKFVLRFFGYFLPDTCLKKFCGKVSKVHNE